MQPTILQNGQVLGTFADNTELFSFLDSGIKILFIIAFGMYVIFSFIVSRQIHTMKKTLVTTFSGWVTLLGYVHLSVAIISFLAVLFFL